MKHLKRYIESKRFIGTSPMKSDINDILLELKDDGFGTFVSIREEDVASVRTLGHYKFLKKSFCKVQIWSQNRFEYSQIEEVMERLKDYMAENNFYVNDFTSFQQGKEKAPKIEVQLNRQHNRFGDEGWTERAYVFEISFNKIPDATNEELKSSTYKAAADKLTKLGHIKRPEELMKWHEITKQKEADALKLKTLNDCKQLGVYELSMSYTKGGQQFSYKGDFYINIYFDDYNLQDQYPEWKEGDSNLWINFGFGVIPVNEDGQKFCTEVIEPIVGLSGDKITYWLGAFWLNLSRGIDPSRETIKLNPEGKGYFEEYEGRWHLSNRASAIRFKDTLFKIFNGDIVIRETTEMPGGMKEQIIDWFCNDREHSIEEYEEVMYSIKRINLNKLYKD